MVGLPDKEYGERVTAFIIAQKDQQPDPAALDNVNTPDDLDDSVLEVAR